MFQRYSVDSVILPWLVHHKREKWLPGQDCWGRDLVWIPRTILVFAGYWEISPVAAYSAHAATSRGSAPDDEQLPVRPMTPHKPSADPPEQHRRDPPVGKDEPQLPV